MEPGSAEAGAGVRISAGGAAAAPAPRGGGRSYAQIIADTKPPPVINIGVKAPSFTDSGEPATFFSTDECHLSASSVKFAIIARCFYGRSPIPEIKSCLTQRLGLSRDYIVSVLNQRHLLFRFEDEGDFLKVMMRRSLYIKGLLYRFFRWEPNFDFSADPTLISVWVGFPMLSVHFYFEDYLRSIAGNLGVVLRIHEPTLATTQTQEALVCVELDIMKPRPERVWIGCGSDGFWQKINYHRVPALCNFCRKLGHAEVDCNKKNRKPSSTDVKGGEKEVGGDPDGFRQAKTWRQRIVSTSKPAVVGNMFAALEDEDPVVEEEVPVVETCFGEGSGVHKAAEAVEVEKDGVVQAGCLHASVPVSPVGRCDANDVLDAGGDSSMAQDTALPNLCVIAAVGDGGVVAPVDGGLASLSHLEGALSKRDSLPVLVRVASKEGNLAGESSNCKLREDSAQHRAGLQMKEGGNPVAVTAVADDVSGKGCSVEGAAADARRDKGGTCSHGLPLEVVLPSFDKGGGIRATAGFGRVDTALAEESANYGVIAAKEMTGIRRMEGVDELARDENIARLGVKPRQDGSLPTPSHPGASKNGYENQVSHLIGRSMTGEGNTATEGYSNSVQDGHVSITMTGNESDKVQTVQLRTFSDAVQTPTAGVASKDTTGSSSSGSRKTISRPSRKGGVRICLPVPRARSPSPPPPTAPYPSRNLAKVGLSVTELARAENIFMPNFSFACEDSDNHDDDDDPCDDYDDRCRRHPGLRPRGVLRRTHSWDDFSL